MKPITPCLWFETEAEEAANFYTSIFKNSKIGAIARYGDAASQASGRPKGSVMTVAFQLNGQDYLALNGGPEFNFTPAVSFIVKCKDQKELDEIWARLTAGGKEVQCGWLEDKFGVSWQIVPELMDDWLNDENPARTERVMAALMPMVKIDIAALKQAFDYEEAVRVR